MVISQETYESLRRPNQTLEKSSNILYAPARQLLDMLGQFLAKLNQGIKHIHRECLCGDGPQVQLVEISSNFSTGFHPNSSYCLQ